MSIRERMKLAISAMTRDRTRYVQLKELTGISGDKWKNFWFDRREPDALMLEALARAWPSYAYWLATGATDLSAGHKCPPNAMCFEVPTTSPVTAEAFHRAGSDLAKNIDETFTSLPEEAEQIAAVLHGFLNGETVHVMPPSGHLSVDKAFKQIRALRQTRLVLQKEMELNQQQ